MKKDIDYHTSLKFSLGFVRAEFFFSSPVALAPLFQFQKMEDLPRAA